MIVPDRNMATMIAIWAVGNLLTLLAVLYVAYRMHLGEPTTPEEVR